MSIVNKFSPLVFPHESANYPPETRPKHWYSIVYEWCKDGCCRIQCVDKTTVPDVDRMNWTYHPDKRRAGVLVVNPNRGTLLLVQSWYKLWGIPKGTMEKNEVPIDCAIRELKEEASIIADKSDLIPYRVGLDNYFLLVLDIEKGSLPIVDTGIVNDSTGFMWVKFDCMLSMINDNTIKLNSNAKYILSHYYSVKIT